MKMTIIALGAILIGGCESASHRVGDFEPVEPSSRCLRGRRARASRDQVGPSLLHEAVRSSDTGRIKALLEAGADVNAPGKWLGFTPLHWAAGLDHVDVIKLLIANGAHVNARTTTLPPLAVRTQETPLHVAARSDRLRAIEVLLDAGADVNAQDFVDKTPLHAAFTNYNTHTAAIVQALVRAGADPNLRDKRNWRPVDMPMAVMLKVLDGKTYRLLREAIDG